jgi:hypothetical protein
MAIAEGFFGFGFSFACFFESGDKIVAAMYSMVGVQRNWRKGIGMPSGDSHSNSVIWGNPLTTTVQYSMYCNISKVQGFLLGLTVPFV